ncbi:MAG TPA: YkgJ family cysteine cluster protein [Desulfurococcales archaeon]|nr:YkgJ family cysteine cluster protein [Desulfurococcales archaeon]
MFNLLVWFTGSLQLKKYKRRELDLWVLPVDCRVNGRYCGKCCYNTEMPLTRSDIDRIKRLGFKENYFTVYRNGIPHLKNVNGHCVFLDPETGMCRIYKYRPLGCRLYPLVYSLDSRRVIVDSECPKSRSIDEKLIRRYIPLLRRLVMEVYKLKI